MDYELLMQIANLLSWKMENLSNQITQILGRINFGLWFIICNSKSLN